MCCPFCGDTEFKFGLNLEDGKAHCFHGRCEWKSRSVVYTARELCKAFGINFGWRLRLSAAEADAAPAEIAPIPEPVPAGLPDEYESFHRAGENLYDLIESKAYDYIQHRGITDEEIQEHHIGFAAAGRFGWRVIFPVIGEDGMVYGCAARDFSGSAERKYLNSDGLKLLWNGQRAAHVAVVVEGAIDGLRVNRVLRQQFPNSVAVAALGGAVTPQQIAQLAKYRQTIHFPDFDTAGVKGAVRRAEATDAAGIETRIVEPPQMDGSDPDNLSDDVVAACLRRARPWTPVEKYRMRLSMLR
jgi:hypothetical protein